MAYFDEAHEKAALSGGLSGALLGGVGSLFDRSLPGIRGMLRAALLGGAGGAALSGGSTYLGSKLLGEPASPDEESPYTKRGAIGGAVGGGAVGAGLGALASSGVFKAPEGLPPAVRAAMIKLQKGALKSRLGRGAALGALGLGGAAAYMGADEGMQLDFIQKQLEDSRRKQALNDIYGG